jgi:ketosteroid isomerase-like protein
VRLVADTSQVVSQENVELVRRLFAELATNFPLGEAESHLSDAALGEFFHPEIEWIPLSQSSLVVSVDVDEIWSSLCTTRNGRVVRVQSFTSRDGALEAAAQRE